MTSCVRDPGDSLTNGVRSLHGRESIDSQRAMSSNHKMAWFMLTSMACVALLGGFTTIVFAVETNIDPAARKAGADESWLQEVSPPSWTSESNQAGAEFGCSVASAGDVNGDGYSDVIVGAQWYGNDLPSEGRAFVYHGSAAGLAVTAAWTAEGNAPNANFGYSVGTAGDVNDDGYADVIVGAPSFSNGQVEEGRAFVYHGSAAGLATTPAWTAESNQTGAELGTSVATAGDVNDDGYADVIVGAIQYTNLQNAEGQVYVFHGSAAGLGPSPDWIIESNHGGAHFGWSVATAGDVNADGYSDVIVGAPRYGALDEGQAFVYHGSAAGLAKSEAWTTVSDRDNAEFGSSVATAGDVNGDGYSDVVVGARRYDNGHIDEGKAYVYHGSPGGLATSAAWTIEGNQTAARYGTSVSSAGDVNDDGYSDVIVGAPRYDNDVSNEGRIFVYLGSEVGLATSPTWTAESDQFGPPEFGISVATAGDVNDDGYADVIVGAPLYSNGQPGEGRAFVYNGPAGGLATSPGWPEEGNRMPASQDLAPSHQPLLGLGSPNPFDRSTEVPYTLVHGGHLRLAVYDVLGREVAVLANGVFPEGRHTARWNGRSTAGTPMPVGVYFLRLDFGRRTESQRIVITR